MATLDEGLVTYARIKELHLDPVQGRFDAAHLREVHRRIFQDLPHHSPGQYRPDAPGHVKARELESTGLRYEVAYARGKEIPERLSKTLESGNLVAELRGLDKAQFSERMARLYGDLDHAHPFKEGNSRTLRAFTQELAAAAGHKLEWEVMATTPKGRDLLYLARDREVFVRAMPGIEREGFEPKDRNQHEAEMLVCGAGRAYPALAKVIETVHRELPVPERVAAKEPEPDRGRDRGIER